MSLEWTTWVLIAGGGLVLAGALLLWRTSDWELKGVALESAWTLLRRKRTRDNPTALERRLRDITAEPTLRRRARRTALTVGQHVVAGVLTLASLIAIAIGALLIGIGLWSN